MAGLVGWWPLHENSGSTARDLSGNGNHGSLNGGVTQGVAGKGGLTAYSFDGSDDYIDISSTVPIGFDDGTWTISTWIKANSIGSFDRILDARDTDSSNGRFGLLLDGNNNDELAVYTHNGTFTTSPSGIVPSLDTWYHLSGRYDGSNLDVFVNGVLENSKATTEGTGAETAIHIAAYVNSSSYKFDGDIADMRLYDRTLSNSEIQKLHEWGNGDYASPPGTRNGEIYKPSSGVVYFDFENSNNDASTAVDRWRSVSASVSGASYNQKGGVRGGGYYAFDSSNSDYIRTDSSISLSDPATFSFWFNTSMSPDSEAGFVGLEDDGSHLYQVVLTSSGQVQGYVWSNNSNNWKEYTDKSFNNGEWYHCAVSYDSQAAEKMQIYINGRKESTTIGQNVNASFSLDQKLNIGRRGFQDLYLNGNIDDVRAYNRALSPSEVFQLYQWGTRGRDMRKLTVNRR